MSAFGLQAYPVYVGDCIRNFHAISMASSYPCLKHLRPSHLTSARATPLRYSSFFSRDGNPFIRSPQVQVHKILLSKVCYQQPWISMASSERNVPEEQSSHVGVLLKAFLASMLRAYLQRNPTARRCMELIQEVEGGRTLAQDHFAFRTFGVSSGRQQSSLRFQCGV